MHSVSLRALAVRALLLLTSRAGLGLADQTTTVTLTSTSTITTITTTVSSSAHVFTSTTTETLGHTSAMPVGTTTQSAAAAATTGAMSYTGDAFQTAILNSTNYYRAQHQAKAMSWDDKLANYAQEYAQKCIWKHSVSIRPNLCVCDTCADSGQGGPYGENLAEGYASPTLAVDGWAGEEAHYNYAKARFTEKTGHFTQLVWKNTTSVGCGAVQCANSAPNGVEGWYVVCEYYPRGNVVGEFKQEVGKPGESQNDKLGLGTASRKGGGSRLLVALAAAYSLLAICT